MKRLLISMTLSAITLSCVTTPTVDDSSSTKIDASAVKDFELKPISAKLTAGLKEYKFKDKTYRAQWFQCVAKQDAPFVAFFHGSAAGNNPQKFCDDWNAQVLLKNGFNVVAVNRPSFNGSNGRDDLAGPQSVAANLAGIKAGVGSGTVVGFWGVDSGVIAATFSSKSWDNLKWLILGNGFYDLETLERTSKNERLNKLIAEQKAAEGEAALESRSIAWDIAGLPKLIAIYHSKHDSLSPKQQADDFNAQLRTAESKVYYDELDAPEGSLPWQFHFQVVEKALKKLKSK